MAIPHRNVLVEDDALLSTLPDSSIQAILTTGIIEALAGNPLDPDAHKDFLLDAANELRCLAPQQVTGILVRKLLELLFFVAATIGNSTRLARFEDIQAIINDPAEDWSQAWVRNWFPGDRTKSYWIRMEDSDGLLPNGTDVLQTAGGFTIVKLFTRVFDPDEVTVPPPYGGTYHASVPVYFPTIEDFRDSFINIPMAMSKDANGILANWEIDPLELELGEQGIDWDVTQIAHYVRIQ